ncbi:MAG TPA: hypothetical protein ENN12_03890 [Epsilonproteobacteria bacterium]|nr:hypothetical protein [Campylobacterota bacterium]
MKKLTLFALTLSVLSAAEYIVPPEYDNTVQAVESRISGLVHNRLTVFSRTSKRLGGRTVRYRCFTVPKIDCRPNTNPSRAQAILNVSEVSLKEPNRNELVTNFGADTILEDAGENWRVCGAAVGGITWDTSTLESQEDPDSGETTLNYTYSPNAQQEIYHFFTDSSQIGALSSYMVIDVKQTCR